MRHQGKTPVNRPTPLEKENDGLQRVQSLELELEARTRTKPTHLRVGIVLWPQFPLLSLAGLCDGLRHAADLGDQSRQVHCAWTLLGASGSRVTSSCGVEVPVQTSFPSVSDFDYIAVIGGLLPALSQGTPEQTRFIEEMSSQAVPLIGICTGSFVLAQLGLMEDHLTCVHPYHVADWKQMFPQLRYTTHCDYVIDRERLTCAGGISIIELTTELVRRHCGSDRAAKVVHQISVSQRDNPSHIGKRLALGYMASNEDIFSQALLLMEKNIHIPLEVAVIAKLLKCSARQLERIFSHEAQSTPSAHYREMRLKYAHWLLLRGGVSVQDVAIETGFSDASHFGRHFQRMYGVSPGQLRRTVVTPPG